MHARASCSGGSRSTRAGGTSSGQQSAKLREHEGRVLEYVPVGVGAEAVAAGVCLPRADVVALPGVAGVVRGGAIELDRQAVLRPAREVVDVEDCGELHQDLGDSGDWDAAVLGGARPRLV